MDGEEAPCVRVILVTASREEGPGIARHLVEKRLAACVNITEISSCYRWEGRYCEEPEALLVIKTTDEKVREALAAIRDVHSYQLPEMIVLPVISGYPPYLAWVKEETLS
ncbi:MAG: Divalent-cation tolerance protein CutA [Methanoregulaceae archaeon PtaU1.Bin059]|nr:MAG: Divalent-cation tolerance protein CutA [Methanoregulaceae archaeon PtaB.Bin152]OPY41599.1 MAG: Divalent-cation tolerance protein CutA [Methanoregulaceae archaeon PtaU1.Bin059]